MLSLGSLRLSISILVNTMTIGGSFTLYVTHVQVRLVFFTGLGNMK